MIASYRFLGGFSWIRLNRSFWCWDRVNVATVAALLDHSIRNKVKNFFKHLKKLHKITIELIHQIRLDRQWHRRHAHIHSLSDNIKVNQSTTKHLTCFRVAIKINQNILSIGDSVVRSEWPVRWVNKCREMKRTCLLSVGSANETNNQNQQDKQVDGERESILFMRMITVKAYRTHLNANTNAKQPVKSSNNSKTKISWFSLMSLFVWRHVIKFCRMC